MSNGLNLPFSGTTLTSDQAFSVSNTGAGVAIAGTTTGSSRGQLHPHKVAVQGSTDDGGGVLGTSQKGVGVTGTSDSGYGIEAISNSNDGIWAVGRNGVHGRSASATDSGVWGENTGGGYGVSGSTNSIYQPGPTGTAGVWGNNPGAGIGVKGTSSGGDAILGYSFSNAHAGVSAVNDSGGFGVWARGRPAGYFEGDVEVAGNVRVSGDIVLANQDCAEDFGIAALEDVEPGSVMVIGHDSALRQSNRAYDRRVAGVISGAGDFKPGIVLGRQRSLDQSDQRVPIALLGRTYCKVDAGSSPIEVGDLLTTSSIPGHAMKAVDPLKAFGAVIGKALQALKEGQGLIPILIALQ